MYIFFLFFTISPRFCNLIYNFISASWLIKFLDYPLQMFPIVPETIYLPFQIVYRITEIGLVLY